MVTCAAITGLLMPTQVLGPKVVPQPTRVLLYKYHALAVQLPVHQVFRSYHLPFDVPTPENP